MLISPNLIVKLAEIKAHFTTLNNQLVHLETAGLPLNDALKSIETVRDSFMDVELASVCSAKNKLEYVLSHNPNLARMQHIACVLNENAPLSPNLKLSPLQLAAFKFAPIVNTDIERSFSRFAALFTDRRRSLTLENFTKRFVLYCNSAHSSDMDAN